MSNPTSDVLVLAAVIKRQAPPELLDTYHAERHPVDAAMVHGTDRAFQASSQPHPWAAAVVRRIGPAVLKLPAVQHRVRDTIGELRVAYPESALSEDHDGSLGPASAADRIHSASNSLTILPTLPYPPMKIIRYLDAAGATHHAALQPDGAARRLEGDLFASPRVTDEPAQIGKLLAPLVPVDILCIGLNYRHHAAESGMKVPERPILFMKSVAALQNPGDPILLPERLKSEEVDYECELAVVIGKRCKNATPENALDFVLGYTCANDVSARDWQIRYGGSQWCRGKTFDTFCPLGPCLVTPDEIGDPNALSIRTFLNDEAVQNWNTNDMIFDVRALIVFLSGSTTLLPGTVILTGTPHGVGMAQKPPRWLRPGDVVTIEIEKIGALTNPVESEK